ncbi:polyprenyl synthetase family protein [Sporosarcina sp. HYO08]|uniref:polyprenyl synthetase family protein n=1 Tax=Sporosarcina sp. HYO08 TaxID=1759557 RepID=UPI0020A5E052|nr:polyprenyl synthetase family protein [Sporosarcina sp. HYO08]
MKPEVIKKSLYDMVNVHITQDELKTKLLSFIDFQSEKGFPFGELLILHYKMFNGEETEEIYTVAAAVEMLILSFDILDDFEDDDFQDQPWSAKSNLALNATTALLFLSASVIRKTSFKNAGKAIAILQEYALRSIHGQHQDLLNRCRSEEDYVQMTMEKSGSLVALACLVGTALATDSAPSEVETYAGYIGLVGQINNDLADIEIWGEKNDLLNKKFSLPIIYLLNCNDAQLGFVRDYYENEVDKDVILTQQKLISEKFVQTGAVTYTEVMRKVYQNKAIAAVKQLQVDSLYKDLLLKYIH